MKANESAVKATQYTCTGLMEGLEYTFRVSAYNMVGQGKPCKQTDFIIARTDVGKMMLDKQTFLMFSMCFQSMI